MRSADLIVSSRWCTRFPSSGAAGASCGTAAGLLLGPGPSCEPVECVETDSGIFGSPPLPPRLLVDELAAESTKAEEPSGRGRGGCTGHRMLPARPRRRALPLLATAVAAPEPSSPSWSSSDTHCSHSSQPRKVAKLLQLTTETGETRSWKMPTKQTMKTMTEQTCCRMTVESATRGQKS